MTLFRASLRRAAAAKDAVEARAILARALDPSDAGLQAAASAFERDMRPVRAAIISALEDGDVVALKGLRAILPHLLAEVNKDPELADVLALQIGKSFVEGLTKSRESR